jgi:hypothetical protein
LISICSAQIYPETGKNPEMGVCQNRPTAIKTALV